MAVQMFWMCVAAYLTIGAAAIWSVEFSCKEKGPTAQMAIMLVALLYGANWPVRAMRSSIRTKS